MIIAKKAQAAMEFLMTYGWAILIVMIAIVALAYFGVLDSADFLPERCLFPAGMDCVGYASADAMTETVKFVLQNNQGSDITIDSIVDDISDDCGTPVLTGCAGIGCTAEALPVTVNNNQKVTLVVNCTDGLDEGRFKGEFNVRYTNENTGVQLTATGSIRSKAI
ncbi:MAG: hypothetical protein KKC26_08305 [Nanoarchaeota archaeon]|nr:hypothetical protein [Nanoarchaeota archaeon]